MRQTFRSEAAPAPIGPYSQAVRYGDSRVVFVSGQVGMDPATGNLVSEDVKAQAEQAMKNLEAVLKASGASFANVVKSGIFLTDLNDFAAVNAIYGRYFEKDPPARSTVQVSALPKQAKVEIDMVAVLNP